MNGPALAAVREQIREAFQDVANPSQERRAHCSRCCQEIDVQQLEFVTRWDEIPQETLFNMSLSFFSPEGFRFALPALMVHALDQPDSGGCEVDNVIWSLAPPDVWDPGRSEDTGDRRRCLAFLDDVQRAAVVTFLAAMVDLSAADEIT